MFSFRLRVRETERLKVQFEESKDERTGDTPADLNQLTDGLVALKVTFLFIRLPLYFNINGGIILSCR